MYTGVFEGKNTKNQQKRILILGESHHYETESTQKVVDGYLDKCRREGHAEKCHEFFDQIVRAFGKDPETEREVFWSSVWFGNYIDELCGVGDSTAVNLLENKNNRKKYNDALFDFVAEKEICVIFCFSRRVYNHLPSLAKRSDEREERINDKIYLLTKDGKQKTDYISYCKYLPGLSHDHTTKELKDTLEVYGMLHPSGRYGFNPENYAPTLSKCIRF